MYKKNSLLTKRVISIFAIVVSLAIIATLLVLPRDNDSDLTESQTSDMLNSVPSSGTPTSSSVPDVSVPDDPIIYPEETVEFQLPDIETSYLQTDIYTTLDNNLFMDALVYTGYNITKHRADGMMWQYVPAASKAGLGYLSKITYGGGSSGYETDSNGKPNIAKFEKSDLVCATFVTYVYLNYFPNVAGIDVSELTAPSNSYSANSWYEAAQDWVEKGYSEYIPFEYKTLGGLGSSFIKFTPSREIPVGSLVFFRNPKTSATSAAHVAIYAGSANGYDWLYHVGNKNGPEFCAVQRMNFGPNARWPIAVITPPSNVRFSPVLEIELVDKTGKPISGSEFILKHPTSGKEISLGTTDENGKLVKEGLSYGDYELVQIVPEGYSCQITSNTIKLSGVNNSYNTIRIVNTKVAS